MGNELDAEKELYSLIMEIPDMSVLPEIIEQGMDLLESMTPVERAALVQYLHPNGAAADNALRGLGYQIS